MGIVWTMTSGIFGERNWRNLALNVEEWKKLLKKARVHAGLSGTDDDDDDTQHKYASYVHITKLIF
jgi:hypothetical protein